MQSYLSAEQARAIDALMPGNQNFGVGTKLRNVLAMAAPARAGHEWFVDGTNGDDTYDGLSWETPFKTITAAIAAAGPFDTIFVLPKKAAAGAADPSDYAETLIIPATHQGLAILGLGNRTQGGLPQIKKGSGSTALLTVRAPGCTILGLGFNGSGSTGGGILFDDDGATKGAWGTSILGCHFKNCKVTALDGQTGGAVMWPAAGGAWQIRIAGNHFYKNVADIVVVGTGVRPQDVVIEGNIFSGPAASVDVNLHLAGGGSGIDGVVIHNNVFSALPALSGGAVNRFMNLAGCAGMLTDNKFGCKNTLTFKAASMGTAAWVPATVFMANNWGEDCTTPFVHTA